MTIKINSTQMGLPVAALALALITFLLGAAADAAAPVAAGTTFSDCDACPEMVVIPPGSFAMGSETDDSEPDEHPVHTVTIDHAFAAGVYEVTRGQFAAFADATGYRADPKCRILRDGQWRWAEGDWQDPGFHQTQDHPVTCIDWPAADAYVTWLANKTGKPYRLLSEAEWEYIARAGTTHPKSYGDDPSRVCALGNIADALAHRANPSWPAAECADGYEFTAPVGSFAPNAFGIYDTQGNAAEWVADCYKKRYDGAPADGSPREFRDWLNGNLSKSQCETRILRGSGWQTCPPALRTANRIWYKPSIRMDTHGFRVARDLQPTE